MKTYKLVASIYFRLGLIHPKELSANFYGLFLLYRTAGRGREGNPHYLYAHKNLQCIRVSTVKGAKPTLQVLQCFHFAKIAVLSPGWKARTDQKAKGRNSCYARDGNIAHKYRKDAVNFVSSSVMLLR